MPQSYGTQLLFHVSCVISENNRWIHSMSFPFIFSKVDLTFVCTGLMCEAATRKNIRCLFLYVWSKSFKELLLIVSIPITSRKTSLGAGMFKH